MNCSVCYEHYSVSTSFFSVFPAGAGVIPGRREPDVFKISFPRRCGGDPGKPLFSEPIEAFSPQVRG